MDKRTRVWNALHNQKVDKIPASVWFHLEENLKFGEKAIKAHLDYYRECEVDFIKIMSDGYFAYPLKKEIINASQWRELEPLPENHPYFIEQVERVKGVTKELSKECMVFYNIFAPFSSIRFAVGDDVVMRHLNEDEEAVLHALNVIAKDNARLAELVIDEAGCDGIYFCVQGGEKIRFSSEEYTRLITPSDLKVLEQANVYSKVNILHCCGWDGYENHLQCWRDYPCIAVNWSEKVEGMELKEGKKYFKDKAVIGGFRNTPNSVLAIGTRKEIEAETIRVLKENAHIPGLILGADCSFHAGLPLWRIKLWMELVHSFSI